MIVCQSPALGGLAAIDIARHVPLDFLWSCMAPILRSGALWIKTLVVTVTDPFRIASRGSDPRANSANGPTAY